MCVVIFIKLQRADFDPGRSLTLNSLRGCCLWGAGGGWSGILGATGRVDGYLFLLGAGGVVRTPETFPSPSSALLLAAM